MRVALLFALAITCVVAADISVQYAGTTSGAPSWTAPDLSGATCVAGSTSAPYVTFNATFPFAGVREVSAMAERAFKSYIRVYIYKGSIPADTCTGLAHNQDLSKQFSTDGGPVIDDFVYFDAALYFFVVTGSTGGIFAVHVDPSDAVGSIVAAGPFWNPISIDSSNECSSSGSVNPFSTYSWTQSTTGQFDVYVMFQNNSITDFEPYIALYRGVPTTSDLSISGCNVTTATLVNTSDASDPGLYLPNITLTVGVNYTLVFSLDGEDELANWAVHVIPTRIRYFDGVDGYTQPEREDPGSACTASSDNDAAWGASYFLAENAVYLIDTSEPPYPYAYIDTYSFLYYGANDATPPASCPLFAPLVLSGDTGDITPVYAFTTIGQNYTVVVSTYGGGSVSPTDVYVLYTFTGAPIGSIPQPTAAPTTTGSATGTATGTNTGTTGTNTGTTATRTTSSSTVTGKVTGSASAVVLSTAAVLAALVALL